MPVPGDRDEFVLADAGPCSEVSAPVELDPSAADALLVEPALGASLAGGAAVPFGFPVLWARTGVSPPPIAAKETVVTAKNRKNGMEHSEKVSSLPSLREEASLVGRYCVRAKGSSAVDVQSTLPNSGAR